MAEAMADAPRLRAGVEVVEPMGSESYVHLRIGDSLVISRVDAHRRLAVGEVVEPAVLRDRAHFFDVTSEALVA
jgi:multiple sugar transport system ATP-binding protein